jgi:DNA-directed RNA polymerase specialized sigma24 family protein
MATTTSLIASVTSYVSKTGSHLSGRQALARWSVSQPSLGAFPAVADLVSACRDGSPADQDRLLGALVSVAHGDHLAQLTVIAALSRRLSATVATWRRAGVSPADLDALQADLVTRLWEVLTTRAVAAAAAAPLTPHLGVELVGQALDELRVQRRRERRAGAHNVYLDGWSGLAAPPGRTAAEALAEEIGSAVRAGRISARAAAPVFLTRVMGYSSAEAAKRLGVTPASVRALRSRAERQLVA